MTEDEEVVIEVEWPNVVGFLMDHGRECGRPRFVRMFMFYAAWLGSLVNTYPSVAYIFQWLPRLFGGCVVRCVTCDEIVYVSGGWIYRFINLIRSVLGVSEYYDRVVISTKDISILPEEERKRLEI